MVWCLCLMSEDEKNAMVIDKEISRLLQEQKKRDRQEIKLLLLGTGEGGKSTFIKQMRIIHGVGFTEDERKEFAKVVYQNIFTSIQAIIKAMESLQIPYGQEENAQNARRLLSVDTYKVATLEPHHASIISGLWKDAGIRTCYKRRSEFHLLDSTSYFLSNLDRIASEGYVPNAQDILRTRVPTTGINEYCFSMQKVTLRIVDVGGQKTERRKWIHCFENVIALIYLASLSEYDQSLEENNSEVPSGMFTRPKASSWRCTVTSSISFSMGHCAAVPLWPSNPGSFTTTTPAPPTRRTSARFSRISRTPFWRATWKSSTWFETSRLQAASRDCWARHPDVASDSRETGEAEFPRKHSCICCRGREEFVISFAPSSCENLGWNWGTGGIQPVWIGSPEPVVEIAGGASHVPLLYAVLFRHAFKDAAKSPFPFHSREGYLKISIPSPLQGKDTAKSPFPPHSRGRILQNLHSHSRERILQNLNSHSTPEEGYCKISIPSPLQGKDTVKSPFPPHSRGRILQNLHSHSTPGKGYCKISIPFPLQGKDTAKSPFPPHPRERILQNLNPHSTPGKGYCKISIPSPLQGKDTAKSPFPPHPRGRILQNLHSHSTLRPSRGGTCRFSKLLKISTTGSPEPAEFHPCFQLYFD